MKAPKPLEFRIISTPENVKPSSDFMKVVGVFNPGVTVVNDETLLMLRVAEIPVEDKILLPHFNVNDTQNSPFELSLDEIPKKNAKWVRDKELFLKKEGHVRLRHISYPLIARSKDGLTIDSIEEKPSFYPCYEHERFGIEDVRITKITTPQGQEDVYAFTYVSPHRRFGVSTSMVTTLDFKKFKRFELHGSPRPIRTLVKDFAIFPEKVKSPEMIKDELHQYKMDYAALTRPNAFSELSSPGIWISYSDNLVYWGGTQRLIGSYNGEYTGTGTPPIKVGNFWLGIYHEVDPRRKKRFGKDKYAAYRGRMFALDYSDPSKVIYRSDFLMNPNEHDHPPGYRPNTVYPIGIVRREDQGIIDIYSGEDDSYTSVRRYYEEDLLKFLKESSTI